MNEREDTPENAAEETGDVESDEPTALRVDAVIEFKDEIGKELERAIRRGVDLNDAEWWTQIIGPRLRNLDRAVSEELELNANLVEEAKELARKRVVELGEAKNSLGQLKAQRDRERERLPGVAKEEFARAILPAADAIDAAGKSLEGADARVLQGFEFISKMMTDALKSQGFAKIDEVGVPFDLNLHEWVREDVVEDSDPDTVTEVLLAGYSNDSNGNLLRPAKVVVAASPPPDSDGGVAK